MQERVCNFVGAVYLSAEEVDNPVRNVYVTPYNMAKHVKPVTNWFLRMENSKMCFEV